jgi:hypothetical protein
MTKFDAYIGGILAKRRRELRVSQREFEPLLRLPYSSISRCEAGIQPLTLMQFVDICRMLDIDAARLLEELGDFRRQEIRAEYAAA